MGAQIVKGKVIAQSVYEGLAAEIADLIRQTGRRPVLVSIYVGSDPAAVVLVIVPVVWACFLLLT